MGRAFDTFKKMTLSIFAPIIGLNEEITDEKTHEDITHVLKLLNDDIGYETTQNCCIGSFVPVLVAIIVICARLFKRMNGKDTEVSDIKKENEALKLKLNALESKVSDLEKAVKDFDNFRGGPLGGPFCSCRGPPNDDENI